MIPSRQLTACTCGELEDHNPLVRCSHPPCPKWQNTLFKHLREVHESPSTNPYLVDILIDGLQAWLTQSPFDTARYPECYQQLIQEQTAIGWRHMFNGHMTNQWRIRQDNYIRQQKIRTLRHTGASWTLPTLTMLWTDFFVLWKARNEAIHGHDSSSQNQARYCRLHTEMEQLHSKCAHVLAVDSDIFIGDTPADLETFLTVSTASHIQNWLHVWRPLIQSSVKSARDMSIQGIQTLTNYFDSIGSPNMTPQHPNSRAHRTTRPCHKTRLKALPQPSFRF
jgi:hypothetical protein